MKKYKLMAYCAYCILPIFIIGCHSKDERDTLFHSITEWQGESDHFSVRGTINGENLDLSTDTSDNSMTFYCTRTYVFPEIEGEYDYESGNLTEIRVTGSASTMLDNEDRTMELEFINHDFQSDTPGTPVTVIPRGAQSPSRNEIWLEWEWLVDGFEVYDSAAQTGSVTLKLFEGVPDETGLIIPENTGRIGLLWSARWSEAEQLSGSLAVPCIENRIEIVSQ